MKGITSIALERVKGKAAGLSALAMSMALPHENKAQRLPLVPVTETSVLEFMSDATVAVGDGVVNARRYALFRDPCYPLWGDVTVKDAAIFMFHTDQWQLPGTANTVLSLPAASYIACQQNAATATLDGSTFLPGILSDRYPVCKIDGDECMYVAGTSVFVARVAGAVNQFGKLLAVDFKYYYQGEWDNCSLQMEGNNAGFVFAGTPFTTNATQGLILEGRIPCGYVKCTGVRTLDPAPVADVSPILQYGMGVGNFVDMGLGAWRSLGTATYLLPLFKPPEFHNSSIPYSAVRATATAALFTNVTAALSKEGTILAARLRPSIAEPDVFNESTLNNVHPRLRYYGALEKGLYTFTTPTAQDSTLGERVLEIPCGDVGCVFKTSRPAFSVDKTGYYNAFILTDTSTAINGGTIMAASLYTHVEFESTSSLFQPGVSTYTLEQLHAAEVALLQFGHFHENPLHWAAIRAAASAALRFVGPMVAPYVQQAGATLLRKGVAYLKGKPAGDRTMPQASMNVPRSKPKAPLRIKVRPKIKTKRRK